MGHVSDFNGVNACDETDLSQVTSELISDGNLLDLNLNENFIYNSFPDDIYRQANLYASSNISSFINTDENRNGYFDEPLELDLFFGSDHNFNIALDDSVPILENEDTSILQSDAPIDFNTGPNVIERNGNAAHTQEKSQAEFLNDAQKSYTESYDDVKKVENHLDIADHSEPSQPVETKTYTAETVFKNSESSGVTSESIPKIIIRLKPEPRSPEQDFCLAESSAPMTIADNVKLGRRRNGNLKVDDSEQSRSKKAHKHKTHKRKSRHKKKQDVAQENQDICERNENCNAKLESNSGAYAGKSLFSNQNITANQGENDSETHHLSSIDTKINLNYQLSGEDTFSLNRSAFVNTDFYTNHHVYNNFGNETGKAEAGVSNQLLAVDHVDSFQFDFEDASVLPLSSDDMKKEVDSSVEEFLDNIDIPLADENIPDLMKSETKNVESVDFVSSAGDSLSSEIHKEAFHITTEEDNGEDNGLIKSGSASDLIEELNAHNQQVFEEIEISTPELELELNDETSTNCHISKASHPLQVSANDKATIQNVAEHGENDMNSQNHLSTNKIPCSSTQTASTFNSTTNYSGTVRPRNISSSSSSVASKSSHRSYRKRRRSSSSNSSSSDREKFYNRPVKYDPVTETYCDEFGREIRPNELKHYLDFKSSRHDSHSNNGSSSSSLSSSKSPRYRSYHRKHHRSRSSSRSHRRRQHSSSRSRSRSRGRKHKGDGDRKHRSPSPKHRSKRQHYLEVEENMRAYEERRVMYVGDIPPDYTVEQLKERFSRFGPVQAASIKSKFTSDGSLYIFGFVTFKNRSDVCSAIERGNENPSWPKFDLNFGGRRRFCNGNYTDLDGKVAEAESGWYCHQSSYRQQPVKKDDDFAELLRQEQKRLGMSKK